METLIYHFLKLTIVICSQATHPEMVGFSLDEDMRLERLWDRLPPPRDMHVRYNSPNNSCAETEVE